MNITAHFYNVVADESRKKFEWGVNDCALFVDSIYRQAFGIDLAGDIRGTYTDEYHASRTLVKLGHWDGILLPKGFIKIDRRQVKRGDIVISNGAAGVWLGTKAIFAGGATRPLGELDVAYTYTL
jgi:cell wall-associated NlpC family hydrolase